MPILMPQVPLANQPANQQLGILEDLMGSGSRTPKMRRLDGRKKKIARIKRRIATAKSATVKGKKG